MGHAAIERKPGFVNLERNFDDIIVTWNREHNTFKVFMIQQDPESGETNEIAIEYPAEDYLRFLEAQVAMTAPRALDLVQLFRGEWLTPHYDASGWQVHTEEGEVRVNCNASTEVALVRVKLPQGTLVAVVVDIEDIVTNTEKEIPIE